MFVWRSDHARTWPWGLQYQDKSAAFCLSLKADGEYGDDEEGSDEEVKRSAHEG